MNVMQDFRIAVIADPHLHDIEADFGTGPGRSFRPASDVVKSLRVFNETAPALRHALTDIASRGIRDVVLLGDLTDDGQIGALDALQRLLDEARGRGLQFWAVPGNHDVFADCGRHRSRRIANAAGGYDLLTSDPNRHDSTADVVRLAPRMRCLGMPAGLPAQTGYRRGPHDLHWETPFGTVSDPDARRYAVSSADGTVTRYLMDASYLIEPAPGVWLLMIDANVWVPYGQDRPEGADAFADATDAGWTAMLTHKAFVLTWMRDVATRAAQQGKRLLTFSHYPVIDPFLDSRRDEIAFLGEIPLSRRCPPKAVANAVAATGIGVHFSGHLHLNATSRISDDPHWLVDVAVPSLAAYPAAYKIVTVSDQLHVETIPIGSMPMPADSVYPEKLAGHTTYGQFLAAHARHLVTRRHLRREWPVSLATLATNQTLADMTGRPEGADLAAIDVISDFYLLRMGREFAADLISPDRLAMYRAVPIRDTQWSPFLAMIRSYLSELPARRFRIDPQTGAVSPI